MTHEIQIAHSTYLSTQIKKRISVGGIDVDEDFVKELTCDRLAITASKGCLRLSSGLQQVKAISATE